MLRDTLLLPPLLPCSHPFSPSALSVDIWGFQLPLSVFGVCILVEQLADIGAPDPDPAVFLHVIHCGMETDTAPPVKCAELGQALTKHKRAYERGGDRPGGA